MTLIVLLYLFGILFLLEQSVVSEELNCSVNTTSLQYNRSLSRKKRYLAFPTGSSFVATVSILKAIQLKEPSNWNLDLEFDMIWPIPNQENLYRRPYKRVKSFHRTRRHKRDLYSTIELALISQGLPGKECVLRTICEANTYLNLPGVSFVDDLLRVILSHEDTVHKMDHYDIAYRTKTECAVEYPCPISILDLLLNNDPHVLI